MNIANPPIITPTTITISGRDLWSSTHEYAEIWYSPSGGKRDDYVSKGFVCLLSSIADRNEKNIRAVHTLIKQLNEHEKQRGSAGRYTDSAISMSIAQGKDKWEKGDTVPRFTHEIYP